MHIHNFHNVLGLIIKLVWQKQSIVDINRSDHSYWHPWWNHKTVTWFWDCNLLDILHIRVTFCLQYYTHSHSFVQDQGKRHHGIHNYKSFSMRTRSGLRFNAKWKGLYNSLYFSKIKKEDQRQWMCRLLIYFLFTC